MQSLKIDLTRIFLDIGFAASSPGRIVHLNLLDLLLLHELEIL